MNFLRIIWSAVTHPHNVWVCHRYPFLRIYNAWDGHFFGYDATWYDCIEPGWREAFGEQLIQDIASALREMHVPKYRWSDTVYFEQIKEKWGGLCLYASAPEYIQDILQKYELLSIGYCMQCGKPARFATTGWVSYLCDNCYSTYLQKHIAQDKQSACYQRDRLGVKDIPMIQHYDSGASRAHNVDLKEKYGIDFMQLWDIK